MTIIRSCRDRHFQSLLWGCLKKNRSMMLLLFSVSFFCMPFLYGISALRTRGALQWAHVSLYGPGALYTDMALLLTTLLWIVAAAVVGLSQTAYMHNRRAVDLYHSLPVTRPQLLAANYLAAFVTVALPMSLSHLITVGLSLYRFVMLPGAQAFYPFDLGGALYGLFGWLVALAGMLSAAFLVATQSGSTFDTLIFSGVMLLAPMGLCLVHILLCGLFLYGYVVNFNWELLCALSPATLNLLPFCSALFYGDYEGPDIWPSLAWLVGAALLFWAAGQLYLRRPSERAQSSSRGGILPLLVRLLALAVASPLLGLLFSRTAAGRITLFYVVLGTSISALLLFFVIEAVLNRGTRGILRAAPLGLALTVVVAGYVGGMTSGGFGYESYLPPAQQVESLTLNYRGRFDGVPYYPADNQHAVEIVDVVPAGQVVQGNPTARTVYQHYTQQAVQLTGQEAIQLAQQLQRTVVQGCRQAGGSWRDYEGYHQGNTLRLRFGYQMQNGKEVYREYNFPLTDEILEALGALSDSDEMNEKCNPLQNTSASDYQSILISGPLGLSEAEFTGPAQIERLLVALSNDVSRESFAQYRAEDKVVLGQVTLISAWQGGDTDAPVEEDLYGSFTLQITEDYINTLAALQKLGYGQLLQGQGAAPAGAVLYPTARVLGYMEENGWLLPGWVSAEWRQDELSRWEQEGFPIVELDARQAENLQGAAQYMLSGGENRGIVGIMFQNADGGLGVPLLVSEAALREMGLDREADSLTWYF